MKKINNFGVKVLSFLRGENVKNGSSKFKGSIFAIVLGLLIAFLPLLIDVYTNGASISRFYEGMFLKPFHKLVLKNTFAYIAIFIIVGGGIGISFKTGLFNIGAAGQMLAAGGVAVVIGILAPAPSIPRPIWIIMIIVISAIIGALVAGIAGVLKAYGNVHEVVSTIMLNWIIFYVFQEIIKIPGIKHDTNNTSKEISSHYGFSFAGMFQHDYIAMFAIAIILMIVIFLIFKYTKFGFSMRMNGLNTEAAKYAGINNKLTTIYSMMLSGALIGIGGYFYYSTVHGILPEMGGLDNVGFESITVTLLSFSSPTGTVLAGFFYGTIYSGAEISAGFAGVSKQTFGLIMGLIIFGVSIAPILIQIKPIQYVRELIISQRNSVIKEEYIKYKELKKSLKSKYKSNLTKYNNEQEIAKNEYIKLIAENNVNSVKTPLLELAVKANYHSQIKKILLENFNKQTKKIDSQSKILNSADILFSRAKLQKQLILDTENFDINHAKNLQSVYINNSKSNRHNYLAIRRKYINIELEKQTNSIFNLFERVGELKPIIRTKIWILVNKNAKLKTLYIQLKKDQKSLKSEYKSKLRSLSDKEQIKALKNDYRHSISKLNSKFFSIRNPFIEKKNEKLALQIPASQLVGGDK